MEQVLTKCPVQQSVSGNRSSSVVSDFGATISDCSDPYNRSFEDDRHNLIESIKSILIAKIEAIHKVVEGLDLIPDVQRVKDFRSDLFPVSNASAKVSR